MRFSVASLAIGSLLSVSLPAFAGTFQYKIDHYPAVGDCHQVAANFGQEFERLTGVRPDLAVCSDISNKDFSFEITYTAAARLALVSTLNPTSVIQRGAFSTLAACEALRGGEAEHFQAETGLEPLVAYCRPHYAFGGEVTYNLRIESFGTPAVQPFVSDTIIFDRPVNVSLDEFLQTVKEALLQRGVDVRFTTLISDGTYAGLTVLYYGTEKFRLSSPELAGVESQQQCMEQLSFAQATRPSRSEAPLALYCGRSMISTYYVIGIYRDLQDPADQLSAERFNSYAQCQAQRQGLVDAYNQRMDGRVTGGLCTIDKELGRAAVWRVRMLLH